MSPDPHPPPAARSPLPPCSLPLPPGPISNQGWPRGLSVWTFASGEALTSLQTRKFASAFAEVAAEVGGNAWARSLIGGASMPEASSRTVPPSAARTLRLTTYNVHACRGGDGLWRPERIFQVIRRVDPHVVALQELDGVESAQYLADRLEMELFFVAARPRHRGEGSYGNAVLTRLPALLIRAANLPRLYETTEARAAQWVRVATPFGPLDVLNTHLGLLRDETTLQAEALLGPEWLSAPEISPYALLCGDFNARPTSPAYKRFSAKLLDAQLSTLTGARPQPTFPAIFPVLRIDHVFLCQTLEAARVEVPSDVRARLASDHRPLCVDVTPRQGLRS